MDDKKSNATSFIVLEIGTGFIDGVYFSQEYAEDMCKSWNESRPKYRHEFIEICPESYDHTKFITISEMRLKGL